MELVIKLMILTILMCDSIFSMAIQKRQLNSNQERKNLIMEFCPGQAKTFDCTGRDALIIADAFYGISDNGTCEYKSGDCIQSTVNSVNTQSVIADFCKNKLTCRWVASSSHKLSECEERDINYLHVEYFCLDLQASNSTTNYQLTTTIDMTSTLNTDKSTLFTTEQTTNNDVLSTIRHTFEFITTKITESEPSTTESLTNPTATFETTSRANTASTTVITTNPTSTTSITTSTTIETYPTTTTAKTSTIITDNPTTTLETSSSAAFTTIITTSPTSTSSVTTSTTSTASTTKNDPTTTTTVSTTIIKTSTIQSYTSASTLNTDLTTNELNTIKETYSTIEYDTSTPFSTLVSEYTTIITTEEDITTEIFTNYDTTSSSNFNVTSTTTPKPNSKSSSTKSPLTEIDDSFETTFLTALFSSVGVIIGTALIMGVVFYCKFKKFSAIHPTVEVKEFIPLK